MNKLFRYLAVLLTGMFTLNAFAAPTLYFDGGFEFDSLSGVLTFDAVIDGVDDISGTSPVGSAFTLSAMLDSSSQSDSFVTATFGTDLDPGMDFNAVDIGSDTLLAGNVNSIDMRGLQGSDFGFVSGSLDSLSGDLVSNFGLDSSLFALELNLTTAFELSMFDQDFSGQIDGQLVGVATPVYEPSSIYLLSIGLFGLLLSARKKR